MRSLVLALFSLITLVVTSVSAQQMSPAEAALQASTLTNQLGSLATNQQRQIEGMQKQIADLQKQLEEARKPAQATPAPAPMGPPPKVEVPKPEPPKLDVPEAIAPMAGPPVPAKPPLKHRALPPLPVIIPPPHGK